MKRKETSGGKRWLHLLSFLGDDDWNVSDFYFRIVHYTRNHTGIIRMSFERILNNNNCWGIKNQNVLFIIFWVLSICLSFIYKQLHQWQNLIYSMEISTCFLNIRFCSSLSFSTCWNQLPGDEPLWNYAIRQNLSSTFHGSGPIG